MQSIKNALLSVFLLALIPAALHAEKITFLTPSWGAPPDKALLESFQKESGITVEIQSVQNKIFLAGLKLQRLPANHQLM